MIFSSDHFIANGGISFLYWEVIPWVDTSRFFIHFSSNAHLSHFHIFAIVNWSFITVGLQVTFHMQFSLLSIDSVSLQYVLCNVSSNMSNHFPTWSILLCIHSVMFLFYVLHSSLPKFIFFWFIYYLKTYYLKHVLTHMDTLREREGGRFFIFHPLLLVQ